MSRARGEQEPSDQALRDRYDTATAALDPPFAAVDLAAFRANADALAQRAGGKPIRVASKSVRCRALLTEVLARPGFGGVLAFTLAEALWLAGSGVEDVLVAYPTVDRGALRRLAVDERLRRAVTLMVDDPDHLELICSVVGPVEWAADPPIRLCLDLDTSWRPLAGRLRVGARRSPLHAPDALAALAGEIGRRPGLRLVGIMGYEAHIAGVGDAPPGRRLYGSAVRVMQRRSAAELAERRAAAVAAVRAVADLEFVNGGGTGSLESTGAEPSVTELAAGSGLYGPTLFDTYRGFRPRPAALFALPVVRRPGPGVATVLGGGYIASGAPGRDRLPSPYLPAGLRLDSQEGAGEVQTPVLGPAADTLRIGDRVWFRHAKAGELCERFDALYLLSGTDLIDRAPTYRGEGMTFL